MQAVGDHGVDKVDWPPELRVFKTADTTHYVVATATTARACATCSGPFDVDDRRSLTVQVRVADPPPAESGFRFRQFAAQVHHRSCTAPRLQVIPAAIDETAADPFAGESDMHYVLMAPSSAETDGLPGLVFTTSDPIVVRELEQAEGRSAWISTYLELGFELFSVAELGWIAAHAPVTTAVAATLDGALFSLTGAIEGQAAPLLEWTRNADHAAYRRWRRAVAAAGALFVLYGEYVHLDPDSGTVDLAPGGRLGDLTAAVVRVEVVPPTDPDHPCDWV